MKIIHINGSAVEAAADQTVLQAVLATGEEIPHVCYHPNLGPIETCDTCIVRGPACHDCVVTVLLGPPPELTIDDDEMRALDVLADSGLVPPLRLVQPLAGPDVESA